MKIEPNGVPNTPSIAVRNVSPANRDGLKITADFDTVQISNYTCLDENGIPKNFLIGGPEELPHGREYEMVRQIEQAYMDYYAGACDGEDVKNVLTEVVESLRDNYVELGYDEKEIMPHIIEDVYARARMEVVLCAHTASFLDSRKLVAQYNGHNGNTKDSIYYDSDYYYKCEAMKTSLWEHARALGEKYGATNLKIPKEFERSDQRYYASSYNTIIDHYAGYQCGIGNMIDEKMVPPKNFRFFYKCGDTGANIYPESLTEVLGDGSDIFDGVLHVWQDDWSFVGRVPTRSHAVLNPAVNMYDAVRMGLPQGIPQKCMDFLKNFDFFSPVQCDNYFRLRFLRNR